MPNEMDIRLSAVEQDIREVKNTVVILDERQQRMHEDFKALTSALDRNTQALADVNQLIANRKGFLAGVVLVVTLLGSAMTAILGFATDWFK